jgi:hypothetical protein
MKLHSIDDSLLGNYTLPTLSRREVPSFVEVTYLHPIPYETELDQLSETFDRVSAYDISSFTRWVTNHAQVPLLAIGAGGSAAAAEVAVFLHEAISGRLSRAGRPMDLYQLRSNATDAAGLFVTAGGSHSDSLRSCSLLPSLPLDWAVYSGTVGASGPLEAADGGVALLEYDLLPVVHGWVAVNSLLAQVVVLVRAYAAAFPDVVGPVPASLREVLPDGAPTVRSLMTALAAEHASVLGAERIMLVHTTETRAAAVDIDSKFAEAGLGDLCVSDLRDFAHGRYQSILGKELRASVVALCTAETRGLTRAMVDMIPSDFPHVVFEIEAESVGAQQIAGVVWSLAFAGAVGALRGRAPGWGSQGTFGDLMYDLNPLEFLEQRSADSA